MKIRSYKGAALEPLYEAIRRELGPEAVVVSVKTPDKKASLLSPLFGGQQYELIAVADDASADLHLLDQVGRTQAAEVSSAQSQRLKAVERALTQLHNDVQDMSKGIAPNARDVPDCAADWDPRFLALLEKQKLDVKADPDGVREALRRLLRAEKNVSVAAQTKPAVFVFVGPTGSGKTTTLAKMAARWCLEAKMKVGLVTTDTFRVAAVDQIREYATLLGIELAVAFSAAEAAAAVQRFSDKDIVLVDTPGRNHFDTTGLVGIRGLVQGMGPVTVLLHIPAALDRRHVSEMLANFQVLKPNYLVLTKVDETRRYSLLTALHCDTECPVAFVTNGQRVPQDIHSATAEELAGMLMPAETAAGGTPGKTGKDSSR